MTDRSGPELGDSPIEAYLDRLLVSLTPGRPRDIRHLMAETEAHLRDAAAEAESKGMSPGEAEGWAVARFGPASELAGAERRRQPTPVGVVLREVMSSGLLLGGIGGLAVGLSGLLAAVLNGIGGSRFVIDVAPGERLAPADCARWLAGDPRAHSCAQAAVADWSFEVIASRVAVGVLGGAAILAFLWLRRRWSKDNRWVVLPSMVVNTIAMTVFGLSGIWLLGLGIDAIIVSSGHGAGQWLSAGPIAMAAAIVFGLRLLADLRRAPAPA